MATGVPVVLGGHGRDAERDEGEDKRHRPDGDNQDESVTARILWMNPRLHEHLL
jgi:hypothetical protein